MYRRLLGVFLGNQVDQRFSILKDAFESEIVTLEELKKHVLDSPMKPKAICESLWFIFGWKSFISEHLSDTPLENHSKYNSFIITSENGYAKLRVKKLPQDSEIVPRAGIRLLKKGHPYGPVKAADLRLERLNFDQVLKGIRIYTENLPLLEKMRIETSWDKLRDRLEELPKSTLYEYMVLSDLPTQRIEQVTIPSYLNVTDNTPPIRGELYPELCVEGRVEEDASVDMDVVVYTKDKRSRPWVGRIVKLLENKKFLLHWYGRKSVRSTIFSALSNNDGSPYIAELENEMVMFWTVSEPQSRKSDSFSISPAWMETIMREYETVDSN